MIPLGWSEPAGAERASRVAALRRGWLRPARFFEPQEQGPFVLGIRAARSGGGPKAQRASSAILRVARARPLCYEVRPRRAIGFLAKFAVSGERNEHGELRASAVGGFGPRDPKGSQELSLARRENRLRFSRPKNSTAPSTAQFSAPCQPHCGFAIAPPLPSPAAILAGLAKCQPAEYAI